MHSNTESKQTSSRVQPQEERSRTPEALAVSTPEVSLLYPSADGRPSAEIRDVPDFFRDLSLDHVVDAITADRSGYDLKPFFFTPLSTVDGIIYRQEVFQDVEQESIRETVELFAARMREMREFLARAEKLYYEKQKERWFLDAGGTYCEAVRALSNDLDRASVSSRGLSAFRDYLHAYVQSDTFVSVEAETRQIQRELASISYCLLIGDGAVTVRRSADEVDYRAEVEETFQKFRQGAVKDYSIKFLPRDSMDHVEAEVLDCVAKLYPEVFGQLHEYRETRARFLAPTVAAFDREIQFYFSVLDFEAVLSNEGLPFSYPVFSDEIKEVHDAEAFDMALAHQLRLGGGRVVCNDFHLSGVQRVLVVTGPNQGGKTTYARAFGQVCYLGALGCPVPGRGARLFLFDRLFTHFERVEDLQTGHGKLKEELIRIRDILGAATPRSVLIMNEIFSATTLMDALFLARKIMTAIIERDILCVCVTFLDELSSLSEKTVSMVGVTDADEPTRRTFMIMPKPADGLAYAVALARKHGLTTEGLRERLLR